MRGLNLLPFGGVSFCWGFLPFFLVHLFWKNFVDTLIWLAVWRRNWTKTRTHKQTRHRHRHGLTGLGKGIDFTVSFDISFTCILWAMALLVFLSLLLWGSLDGRERDLCITRPITFFFSVLSFLLPALLSLSVSTFNCKGQNTRWEWGGRSRLYNFHFLFLFFRWSYIYFSWRTSKRVGTYSRS